MKYYTSKPTGIKLGYHLGEIKTIEIRRADLIQYDGIKYKIAFYEQDLDLAYFQKIDLAQIIIARLYADLFHFVLLALLIIHYFFCPK